MAHFRAKKVRDVERKAEPVVPQAPVEYDGPLPWTSLEQDLTVNNLESVTFEYFLQSLEPALLEKIPEGGDSPEALKKIDEQLGRFANVHAYLIYLFAAASYSTSKHARIDKKGQDYANMVRKKDALYEFADAIELKWKACSRMLTKAMGSEDEVPYDRRRMPRAEEAFGGNARPPIKGWGTVS